MINKKIIFLTITLVFIASLGIISATDINNTENTHTDTTTLHQQDTIQTQSIATNNKTTQQKKSTKNIQKAENKNTKTSSEIVHNASALEQAIKDGINIITMTGDDSDYNITSLNVMINNGDDVTVYGNGITINGNVSLSNPGMDPYFQIDTYSKFTVHDVKFVNFNLSYGIFFLNDEDNEVNIINCTFINNTFSTKSLITSPNYLYNEVNIINSTFEENIGISRTSIVKFPNIGSYSITGTTFKNNNNLFNENGPINASNINFNLTNSIFENNTRANFEVIRSDDGTNHIKLVNNDSYITNINDYQLYDGEELLYGGRYVEEYVFSDYTDLRLIVYGTQNKYYNNTYLFGKSVLPPKTYVVNNYQELARAIDDAKTVDETEIIINLVPHRDYNATTSMIWGNKTNTGTELPDTQPKHVTINGNGTVVNGKNIYQFINIGRYYNLTIENITITNYTATTGGAFNVSDEVILDINNVTFIANNAQKGGAIYAMGVTYINNSVFINNTASDIGGDFYKYGWTWYNITNSNFTGNTPYKIEQVKIDDDFRLKILKDDYDIPFNSEIEIFENGESKGTYSLDNNYIIKDYNVPLDYNELELIINSPYPTQYDNNRYFLSTEVNVYDVEIQTVNDIIGNVKINVTVKDTDGQPIIGQEVNLTLPNGTIIKEKTDENGNITFTPQLDIGLHTLNISIIGDENYKNYNATRILEVKPIPTNTRIEVLNNIVNNTIINVTVTNPEGELLDSGIIIITDENGEGITAGLIKNKAAIIKLDIPSGQHNIIAIYQGNTTHSTSNTTKNIKILQQAEITIKILNNTEGNVTIEYQVTNGTDPIQNADMTIILPNGTTTTQKTNPQGKIIITDPTATMGDKNTTATITTTDVYNGTSTTKDVTIIAKEITKIATEIIIDAPKTVVNNNTYSIKIAVKEILDDEKINLPCNITLVINGETTTKELTTGETIIPYTPSIVGTNTISAYFEENETHNSSMNTTTFEVSKRNTNITASQDKNIKDNVTINYNVEDILLESPISKGRITVYDEDNNIIKSAEFNKQTNTITITDLTPGEHTLTIVYDGNTTYNQSSKTLTVKQLPKADITIKVLNNTEGNVQIEYTVTNGTDPITDSVIIVLPNGTSTTKTPTSEGKIIITDTTTTPGNYTTTATIQTTDKIIGTSTTEELTIVPDYQKIIDELKETIEDMNNTIKDLNDTVQEQKQTIADMNNTIKDLNDTVQEQKQQIEDMNKTIKDLNDTVQEQKQTIADMNNTIKDLNNTVQEQKQQIEDMNKTIKDLNNTVLEQKETIEDMNNTIKNLNNTVQEQKQTIKDMNDTINKQKQTIKDLENKVKDLNKTVQEQKDTIDKQKDKIDKLEDTIDTWNKTSTIKAVPENGTVDNNKVIVTLENKLTEPITNAPVKVVNSAGETIGTGKTDKDGIAVIPLKTEAGTENITVVYAGDKKHTPANKTVSTTTVKNNVTLTVNPVKGIIGEKVTLTAHITDVNGNPITGGNLVFKLNGKTLKTDGRFDSNATAWKFNVEKGKVTITITANIYLHNAKNLTASYSGTYKYNEAKSKVVPAQISKRNAQISITTTPTKQKQYNTIKFTATLKDTTPNTKNKTAINTGTKVQFKINGNTLKDSKGNNIQVKVVNKTATYKYTVPQGMGGVTKDGSIRDYTVEAVLVSDTYYPDTRNTTTFNVERSPITININKVTVNSNNKLNINAKIKDYKGNNVIGSNDINIKINGKSYVNPTTNKTQNFKVSNGTVNLKNIQVAKGITIKKITIVTGARQAYLAQRNETTNIIKI